jgi:hypothetical protein
VSDNWLRLIPTEPAWVPDREAQARIEAAFAALVPRAAEVTVETHEEAVFVDCGGNFESIHCPVCGAALTIASWQEMMDAASATRFTALDMPAPCCGTSVSLNDLRYQWPMGFARWEISARSPDRRALTDAEIRGLEHAVGHSLRQIWQHI